MTEDEDRHRKWSIWAAVNIVHALRDAGLVTGTGEDEAIDIAKERLFDLLTEPERWAKAFPGKTGG